MEQNYSYIVSENDFNKYDIFEVGGEIVAKSVDFDLVDKIVDFLNSISNEKPNGINYGYKNS
jgi:hypothetical protein